MDRIYWAAKPSEEAGQEVYRRVEQFYRQVDTTGYFSLMRKSFAAYFGSSSDNSATGRIFQSGAIRRGGVQGETYDLKVNEFRNLCQHLLVLTTSERPALEAMAINTDYKSQAQTELAEGLLEYYMTEKRLERPLVTAAEYAIVFGGGHVVDTWDPALGRPYEGDPETGQVIHEGDLRVEAKTPLDVIVDSLNPDRDLQWGIVREYVNRYDLAAQNEEMADRILAVESIDKEFDRFSFTSSINTAESDLVPVYNFYHDRTPALKNGRYIQILPGGEILFDGPLPYKKLPIKTIQPARFFGTPFGYSPAFDLLGIQEGVDTITSAVLTNQASFGVQNIWLQRGHNISVQQLQGGMNVLETEPGMKPEPLNLTHTPPEIMNFIEHLTSSMERLMGLNSVVRGQPQGQLSGASGSAMALLASQAIQFSYGLQREYEFLIEDVGTSIVQKLQEFATTPRVALIAGITKRSYLKEYTGEDIDHVDRVVVKRTSAISKTTAGKTEIAKNLLDAGFVESPEQYLTVIKTGNLEPMIEGKRMEIMNIKAENEKLREGGQPMAIVIDNHALHIQEHKAVLSDPEIREDFEVTSAVLAHIQEHIEHMRSGDPDLLALVGSQSLAPMEGGQPMGGGPSPDGAAAPGGEPFQGGAEQLEAAQPAMPSMPSLPNGAPEESQEAYEDINPM